MCPFKLHRLKPTFLAKHHGRVRGFSPQRALRERPEEQTSVCQRLRLVEEKTVRSFNEDRLGDCACVCVCVCGSVLIGRFMVVQQWTRPELLLL